MQVLYLDRVINFRKREVPRMVPAYVGWTNELAKQREKTEIKNGGFGKGRIEEALKNEQNEAIVGREQHVYIMDGMEGTSKRNEV